MRRGLALLAALLLAAVASPAAASCMAPPDPPEHLAMADVVFVGTVTRLANGDRDATFAVQEQWKGLPLAAVAIVHGGGTPDPNSFTTVDRTFELGRRYLVAAGTVDGRLSDNACSATQLWSAELATLRPPNAWMPETEPADGGPPLQVLIAIGAVAMVAFGAALAFRRGAASGPSA
ncbi:MAG: hypothetical protein ACRDHD_00285 [Candidatus Limnocylindria bacterium]